MKALITTLLLLTLTLTSAFGQLKNRIGSNQAITNDWRPGFVNITELSCGLGLGNTKVPYSQSFVGVNNTFAYQFMRRIKGGAGVGVQFHNEGMLIPVYLDGRFNFPNGKWSPFISASGGYAISPDNFKDQSRIYFNPVAGVRLIYKKNFAYTISAGLLTQAGGAEMRSSFINIKLGAEFKAKNGRY
ncbi:MAG TPA: hypothetical protein PKH02_04040 [Bacteroidales bacterium]|nr:hypothetical protein [Bacteroidales bacterium]